MVDKADKTEMSAKLMAEHANALVAHIENSLDASVDDYYKAAILKAAAGIYEQKASREMIVAGMLRTLGGLGQ